MFVELLDELDTLPPLDCEPERVEELDELP